MLIGATFGILLGIAAMLNRNSLIDGGVSVLSTRGRTIAVCVISTMLIMVFAVWLG